MGKQVDPDQLVNQDLHCLLFLYNRLFLTKNSVDPDQMADLDLHWSHMQYPYIWSKRLTLKKILD
jgi:hypothetical protein